MLSNFYFHSFALKSKGKALQIYRDGTWNNFRSEIDSFFFISLSYTTRCIDHFCNTFMPLQNMPFSAGFVAEYTT